MKINICFKKGILIEKEYLKVYKNNIMRGKKMNFIKRKKLMKRKLGK